MNILVAIEPSPFSEAAIKEVAARVWPAGTNIYVLTVIDSTLIGNSRGLIEGATHSARSFVKMAAALVKPCGMNVCTAVLEGRPRREIIGYAKEIDADYLIVGSHGRGAVGRFLLGSVAQAMLREAPCSVEVVRARATEPRLNDPMRILLATDGSHYSLAAARSIADRPWPKGTEVKIISVVEVIIPAIEPGFVDTYLAGRVQDTAAQQAQEALSTSREVLSNTGLAISMADPVGNPKAAIIDTATEFDATLIVLGSEGRHGMDRLLMGSVSESIALYAHCSVAVIRERAKE